MKIQKSAEDYLESILMINEQKGFVRSIDVATELGVTKPSVSYAVKRLRENGYITVDDSGHLHLTAAGHAIAVRIYERHKVLTAFLSGIGVSPETAAEDACKIEHDLCDETFAAIKKHCGDIGTI